MMNEKKIIKTAVLVVLVFALIPLLLYGDWLRPNCENDKCGRVVGWIFDDNTKEIIKDRFHLNLCDCFETDKSKIVDGEHVIYYFPQVTEDGRFSIEVPEGDYCLQFMPVKIDKNYCYDPIPSLSPEYTQKIKVRKGKVTVVKKYIKPGGKLKLILVDKNNNKMNPNEVFKTEFTIFISLSNDKVYPYFPGDYGTSDDIDDGEMLIQSLFPGTYLVFLEFRNMGYGSQCVDNVKIERNQTTELRILVDMLDKTGIEGKVCDQHENPIKNALNTIYFHDNSTVGYLGTIRTDNNGYYKIVGLKENKYDLFIEFEANGNRLINKITNILITKNVILKKDIKININQ